MRQMFVYFPEIPLAFPQQSFVSPLSKQHKDHTSPPACVALVFHSGSCCSLKLDALPANFGHLHPVIVNASCEVACLPFWTLFLSGSRCRSEPVRQRPRWCRRVFRCMCVYLSRISTKKRRNVKRWTWQWTADKNTLTLWTRRKHDRHSRPCQHMTPDSLKDNNTAGRAKVSLAPVCVAIVVSDSASNTWSYWSTLILSLSINTKAGFLNRLLCAEH